MTNRRLFLEHVGQTSDAPLGINMVRAEGTRMWDKEGKEYLDLIAGISVCNVGHRHPEILKAISDQLQQYMHIMVYGELIENPQVAYAHLLASHLPAGLGSVFFTNSGSEATEGAMKLAKRYTGRTEIISFRNSYHGSTQGALSIMGSEYWQQAFRPLLPGIRQLEFNSLTDLDQISGETACVVAETVQAEAGVILPDPVWIEKLREKCTQNGALLVLDEIQCGFGRNGTLWAFDQFGIVPDILLLGKALGGGMPLGAFISSRKIMQTLTRDPELGHITTFGGHPVCCAAGKAAMEVLLKEDLINQIKEKEKSFRSLLIHDKVVKVNSCGLMIAVHLESFETCKKVINGLLKEGIFTDWFLFAPHAIRIVPSLTINEEEIRSACGKMLKVLDGI